MKYKAPPPKNGACVGKTDLFFLTPSPTREVLEKQRQALALCKSCDQLEQCRNYALHHEAYGIWGGLNERQRKALRRELGIRLERLHPESLFPQS